MGILSSRQTKPAAAQGDRVPEEAMKVVVGILFLFALFIVLMNIFGSVECTGLANQTALGLSRGVDRVSSPDFPYWDGDSQPTDPIYYDTADVKLCQEHTDGLEGYWRAFWGGSVPQYQIYYERFPEGFFSGGAAMWEESYPWSGGAGGQLVFWGALRSGKYLLVGAKKVMGPVSIKNYFKAFQQWLSIKTGISAAHAANRVELARVIAKFYETGTGKSFGGEVFAAQYLKRMGKNDIETLVDTGFVYNKVKVVKVEAADLSGKIPAGSEIEVVSDMTTDGRIPLENKEVPLQIVDKDGTKRYLHIREEGEKIVEVRHTVYPDTPPGFKTVTINPAESFELYLKDIADPEEAVRLRKMFSTDWKPEDLVNYKNVPADEVLRKYEISQTQFFKEAYHPILAKFRKLFTSLDRVGYAVEEHAVDPVQGKALVDSLSEGLSPDRLNQLLALQPYTKFKSAVVKKLGLKSEAYVDNVATQRYLEQFSKTMVHPSFVPKDSKLYQYLLVQDLLKKNPARDIDEAFVKEVQDKITKESLGQKLGTTPRVKPPSSAEIKSIAEEWDVATGYTSDYAEQNKRYFTHYLDNYVFKEQDIVDETGNVIDTAPVERLRFIGFVEQNTDPFPTTYKAQFGRLEVQKIMVLDLSAFANVRGWWWKGEITASTVEETCTDNSICLYAHGQRFEKPIYLNNDSQKFFVRSWRPLGAERFAGIQAALMSIPPNPRFHLVGPCMGTAIIWKVQDYEGEPTVFVAMDKTDLGDKASNYCYVDADYAHEYIKIWGASDIITVVEAVLTGGQSTATKALVKSGFSYADPATLIQAFWEGTISWPKDMSKTFSSLTPQKMREALIPTETTTTIKGV